MRKPELEPPGPLMWLIVFAATLILFAAVNATAIETLLEHDALSTAQLVRIILSAVLCGGFALLVVSKMRALAEPTADSVSTDAS